jgi:hypothetical protein
MVELHRWLLPWLARVCLFVEVGSHACSIAEIAMWCTLGRSNAHELDRLG